MKLRRTETIVLVAMAIVMCLTLVGAGGVVWYATSRPAIPAVTAVAIVTSIPTAVVQSTNTAASFPATWTPVPTMTPKPPTDAPTPTPTPKSADQEWYITCKRETASMTSAQISQFVSRPDIANVKGWRGRVSDVQEDTSSSLGRWMVYFRYANNEILPPVGAFGTNDSRAATLKKEQHIVISGTIDVYQSCEILILKNVTFDFEQ